MNRFGFFNPDPAASMALVAALAIAASRPRRPLPPPTEVMLARLYDEAKREDWNRAVAARKAAKQARKDAT